MLAVSTVDLYIMRLFMYAQLALVLIGFLMIAIGVVKVIRGMFNPR